MISNITAGCWFIDSFEALIGVETGIRNLSVDTEEPLRRKQLQSRQFTPEPNESGLERLRPIRSYDPAKVSCFFHPRSSRFCRATDSEPAGQTLPRKEER